MCTAVIVDPGDQPRLTVRIRCLQAQHRIVEATADGGASYSPVDALLSLYDSERKLLAAVDDVGGSPDPIISIVLPRDGTYFLTAIDSHDLGGPQFGYRLLLRKE